MRNEIFGKSDNNRLTSIIHLSYKVLAGVHCEPKAHSSIK